MRFLVAAGAAFVLSHSAWGQDNDFRQTTDKALAAGGPEAVVRALDRETYRGNLVAALELGLMYHDGRIVPRDPVKARKFLEIAASTNLNRIWYRRGLAEAQYMLAVMLQSGSGGRADPSEAASWFREAAEKGETRSQLALAKMYSNGAGIARDPERAFFWSSVVAASLADAAQKEAEQIRDQSQQLLEPKKLAKVKTLVDGWKPKRS
jgi:TPR repeat protein